MTGGDPAAPLPPPPDPPKRVVRLCLEFAGAAFVGWQRQPNGRSVQQVLEEALERLLSENVVVHGAGRTDSGVHAHGMVASFSTRSSMPAATILRALDALLDDDVAVLSVADAPEGFHATNDACWKWYRYTILRSKTRRVPFRDTSWRVEASLSLAAMREAASALVGTHDFAAFQASGSPRRSTVRTVAALTIEEDGPRLHVDLVADGFLYGMARAIVGTLVEVGRGARAPDSVEALMASRDRRKAGPAAPAKGLALVAVGYAGDAPPAFVDRSLARALAACRRKPVASPTRPKRGREAQAEGPGGGLQSR